MIKKIKYLLMALILGVFTSCEKEEVGMTSTVEFAGEWLVTVDMADASGNVIAENILGTPVQILTYNTNADDGKEIYINDSKKFWDFIVRIPCECTTLSFGSTTPVPNESYACDVTVTNGKITFKGAVSPQNMPVDAIQFDIAFSDDEDDYIYKVHGYRRTGFNEGTE